MFSNEKIITNKIINNKIKQSFKTTNFNKIKIYPI